LLSPRFDVKSGEQTRGGSGPGLRRNDILLWSESGRELVYHHRVVGGGEARGGAGYETCAA
ncbi:MAG TPA: hypothetical protein DHK64_14290, partial [Rhodobiaceae bacterium]|nr:hypothetical protein [Rhodobiaceae bacterium]